MLVIRNSTKTDKPVTKSALTLQPPPHSPSVLYFTVFKAI